MYKLVISDDEGHATVVPLLRDEITIGRIQGNDVGLPKSNISKRHARIINNNGQFVVIDSQNGGGKQCRIYCAGFADGHTADRNACWHLSNG